MDQRVLNIGKVIVGFLVGIPVCLFIEMAVLYSLPWPDMNIPFPWVTAIAVALLITIWVAIYLHASAKSWVVGMAIASLCVFAFLLRIAEGAYCRRLVPIDNLGEIDREVKDERC